MPRDTRNQDVRVAKRGLIGGQTHAFRPFVAAGVLKTAALAGYRSAPVDIRDSRHVPPRAEAVRQAMPTLFDFLTHEEDPSARAVLGHWLVGHIHPFIRMGMDVSHALDAASVESDLRPFAHFLAERVLWSSERA